MLFCDIGDRQWFKRAGYDRPFMKCTTVLADGEYNSREYLPDREDGMHQMIVHRIEATEEVEPIDNPFGDVR